MTDQEKIKRLSNVVFAIIIILQQLVPEFREAIKALMDEVERIEPSK